MDLIKLVVPRFRVGASVRFFVKPFDDHQWHTGGELHLLARQRFGVDVNGHIERNDRVAVTRPWQGGNRLSIKNKLGGTTPINSTA